MNKTNISLKCSYSVYSNDEVVINFTKADIEDALEQIEASGIQMLSLVGFLNGLHLNLKREQMRLEARRKNAWQDCKDT